jgi:hypothetical protein
LYTPGEPDESTHEFLIDGQHVLADFMDISSTTIREAEPGFNPYIFQQMLCRADGVSLLYDVTDLESFERVTNEAYAYVWMCKRSIKGKNGAEAVENCEFILVGNKADIVRKEPKKRAVDKKMAEEWAWSKGFRHAEVSSNERSEVSGVAERLVWSILRTQGRMEGVTEEKVEKQKREMEFGKGKMDQGRSSLRTKVMRALGKSKSGA